MERNGAIINASRDVLGNLDALHLKEAKYQNTDRKSIQGSFASLVQRLKTLFIEEVAAVSKLADSSGREALIMLP